MRSVPVAHVRPYTDADLGGVLDVWYRASLVGHAFLSAEFLADERQMVAEVFLPNSRSFVAEEDGRVVGYVALRDDEVGGLFVDPDRHRQGLGRQLLDHVRTSRPIHRVTVFEANTGARAFYEAYGFRVVDRVISEIEDQPELHMRLDPDAG
jgi:putative acetyltransferase